MKSDFAGMLLLLSCVAIWGANAVAFKVGTHPAEGVGFDPLLLNGLRFLCVAPILCAFIAVRDPKAFYVADKRDFLRYAVFGAVGIVLSETLLASAVSYTSIANMTLLGPGTTPLFTALWASVLDKQPLTRRALVGAMVAMAGVAVVAASGHAAFALSGTSLIGDGIALLRSVIQGAYLLFLSRALSERNPNTVTVYNVLFGTLWFLPYVLYRTPGIAWHAVTAPVWWSLAWTVVPTSVYGFLVWNTTMPRVGAVAATNVFYLLPVFGALSAWVVLGTPVTPAQLGGGAVIVAGLIILRWEMLVNAGIVPGKTTILQNGRQGGV